MQSHLYDMYQNQKSIETNNVVVVVNLGIK